MRPKNILYGTHAREQIIEALLSLMDTYPFDQITILQITQQADISRRTFYLYYRTKHDILNNYYDVLAKEYYQKIKPNIRNDFMTQAVMFFSFWGEHSHYLVLLERNNLLYILFANIEKYLWEMTVPESISKNNQYLSAFFAGGLWATLISWIRNDFKETPSELAKVVIQFESIGVFKNIPFYDEQGVR